MEVSVDSMIEKPFCSRNFDEKLEIAKAEKPPPKLNILSSKLGCLKTRLMLVRVFALNFRALPHIKSSLYSPYYAEAYNELRGLSPRLSAWATQLRGNVATVASRWRHCVDLTGPGVEPQTSRTDSVRFAIELTV